MLENGPIEGQAPIIGTAVDAEQRVYQPLTHIIARPGVSFSFTPIIDTARIRALNPRFVGYDADVGNTVDVATLELEGTDVRGEIVITEVDTILDALDKR